MTHDLLELIKDKDYLLKKARKSKLDTDKANARQARNLVNSLIKRARSDYVKEQLDANRNDPKKFWEVIKNVFGDNNMNERLALFDDLDNPIAEHDTSLFINNFFARVGPNLANHINDFYGVELEQDRLNPVGIMVTTKLLTGNLLRMKMFLNKLKSYKYIKPVVSH